MDKIDLDAIARNKVDDYHYLLPAIQQSIREYAKEIAHQAIVLASENAEVIDDSAGNKMVSGQSILDVEKLIVNV